MFLKGKVYKFNVVKYRDDVEKNTKIVDLLNKRFHKDRIDAGNIGKFISQSNSPYVTMADKDGDKWSMFREWFDLC